MGKPGLVARPNCSWKSTSQVVVLSTTSSCLTQMLCCRVCNHATPTEHVRCWMLTYSLCQPRSTIVPLQTCPSLVASYNHGLTALRQASLMAGAGHHI